jgi:hypothetical protein
VGERKRKLTKNQRFLADHPYCCFCGGTVAAMTADHVPNRAFFVNRDWPEGYEFPSCSDCQVGSRVSELVCAAVMRAAPAPNEFVVDEVARLFRGFSHNDPDAWKEFVGVERTRRSFFPHRCNGGCVGPMVAECSIWGRKFMFISKTTLLS